MQIMSKTNNLFNYFIPSIYSCNWIERIKHIKENNSKKPKSNQTIIYTNCNIFSSFIDSSHEEHSLYNDHIDH